MNDEFDGAALPHLVTSIPGPISSVLVDGLAMWECPGLTARRQRRAELSRADHDPIVWQRAQGACVRDVDGNRFVDMTAGFGAALIGHGHPRVVEAVRAQATVMMHALGDVFPSDAKVALEGRLAAMAPWPARVILGLSGADAVEAALKTAALSTGRSGVLAFTGGYHGLSYGAVAVCGYKESFRAPFAAQVNPRVTFAPYPAGDVEREVVWRSVDDALRGGDIGAVLVEPILGRGGVVVPAQGALRELGERARAAGAVVIADEIYTGLGRTGPRFRSVDEGMEPDVICLGKAMGGGMPVSAVLIREEVAQAWGRMRGEAIHTSTFLGNPLACAAAMAALDVLDDAETTAQIASCGEHLGAVLRDAVGDRVTRAGLLLGVALDGGAARSLAVSRALLERGYIALTGGVRGDVLTLTPPCVLTRAQAEGFAAALAATMG